MTRQPTLEIIANDNNRCGESPIWDPARSRLLWTDIPSNLLYEFTSAGSNKTIISRDLNVSAIALNRAGGLILGGADGLHLWRQQGQYRTIVAEHDGEKLAINDLIADPHGRIYAGTCYWGPTAIEKPGKLYVIDPAGTARVLDDGILLANGLAFSIDNRILYFADSAARRIYAYDVHPDTGALSAKRIFVQIPADEGIPDGLTVDSEDHLWSAQWYGSQIVSYDPDGKVKQRIALPVRQVSSLGFGGKELTDLYITTAAEAWPSEIAPAGYDFNAANLGGSLYRVRLDVAGKREHLAAFSW